MNTLISITILFSFKLFYRTVKVIAFDAVEYPKSFCAYNLIVYENDDVRLVIVIGLEMLVVSIIVTPLLNE
jgi:hypothetical protein